MQKPLYIPSRREFLALSASMAVIGLSSRWSVADKAAAALAKDERSAFFAEGVIPKLGIEIAKEDVKSLKGDPRKYVKAQIKEDDKTEYKDVGIHMKGAAGSFRDFDDRPGLTLNMDKFTDGQRFHGLDKLHLNNSVQDNTWLTDLLCSELFRSVGVPATKISHAIVTLNGRARGFYVLKEGFDKGFLKSTFGGSNGNFYDGGFLKDIDQPLELNGGKENTKDQPELKALTEAARENDHQKRLDKLEKLLDFDKFLSYLAMEVIVWDWDGYPMQRNNYRLYHEPKTNKITFIPSGMDQMWGDPNGPLFPNFNGMVARSLVETKEGRKRYLQRMQKLLTESYKPEELVKRLDALQAHIQPVLKTVDEGAANDLPNRVNRLREAIPMRAKVLKEQLGREKF